MRCCTFLLALAFALALSTIAHAQEADPPIVPDPAVAAAADQVGVDPWDLQGAVFTTGLGPADYLCAVGEGPCPRPVIPPVRGAVGRADCIIGKESGGRDVPNRQGSGASGPGQYFPSTWARHAALYRAGTGYAGPLSLHAYGDVERVMAFMLAAYPASRGEWAVGGC